MPARYTGSSCRTRFQLSRQNLPIEERGHLNAGSPCVRVCDPGARTKPARLCLTNQNGPMQDRVKRTNAQWFPVFEQACESAE